jgi:hypothetical protein
MYVILDITTGHWEIRSVRDNHTYVRYSVVSVRNQIMYPGARNMRLMRSVR